MIFNNLCLYKINLLDGFDLERINRLLDQKQLRDCGKTETHTFGWAQPSEEADTFALEVDQFIVLSTIKQERLLPATIIRDELKTKVAVIEQGEDRKVYSKEKQKLREQIMFEMLPRAFVKKQQTFMFIDIKEGILAIASTNKSRCDAIVELMVKTFSDIKLQPLTTQTPIAQTLTHWVLEKQQPTHFLIEDVGVLKDKNSQKALIRIQYHDLFSEEVASLIQKGKFIHELSLTWQDKLSLTVNENFVLKRIKFLDIYNDTLVDEEDEGTELLKLIAEMHLMCATLRELIQELAEHFGGIAIAEDIKSEMYS